MKQTQTLEYMTPHIWVPPNLNEISNYEQYVHALAADLNLLAYPFFLKPAYDAIFERDDIRFIVSFNGRGTGRTTSFSKFLNYIMLLKRGRYVCAREMKVSLDESMFAVQAEEIVDKGLEGSHYKITTSPMRITEINTKAVTNYIGLQTHTSSRQKGRALNDGMVIDECQEISQLSWERTEPTFRDGVYRQIPWIALIGNPENDDDPLYDQFMVKTPPPRTVFCQGDITDNPWAALVNREQSALLKEDDFELWKHIYGGATRSTAKLAVFSNFRWGDRDAEVRQLKLKPMLGFDPGYSSSPSRAVEVYHIPHRNELYIAHEANAYECELQDTAGLIAGDPCKLNHKWKNEQGYRGLPAAGLNQYPIIADNNRPETIKLLERQGLKIRKTKLKNKGDVEDRIEFQRSFTIIINKRCPASYSDYCKYSFEEDKKTGKKTERLVKQHDDTPDAVGYATEDLLLQRRKKNRHSGLFRGIQR